MDAHAESAVKSPVFYDISDGVDPIDTEGDAHRSGSVSREEVLVLLDQWDFMIGEWIGVLRAPCLTWHANVDGLEADEADTIDAFLRPLADSVVPDAVHNGVITETASHVHLSAAARSNEADADGLEAEPDGYITDDDLPFAAYQVGTCSGKATREASLDLQVLDLAHGRSDVAGHEAFVGAVAPAAVESSQVASMDLGVAVRGRGPAHGEAEHRSEPLRLQGSLAQRRCGSLGLAGHGDAALAAELCRRPPGRKARRRTAKLMATAAAGSPAVPSEQVGEEVTEPPGDEVDDGREQELHEKLVQVTIGTYGSDGSDGSDGCDEAQAEQAKQARDITGLRFAISIAEAMQCEAAEVALSYQCRVRMYEFLRNIIDEAEAAGLGDEDGELWTRRVSLSALLSMPSISAKAMLAHMVAQQRALVAGMRAECGLPAG